MEGLDVIEAGQHAGAAMRNVGPEGRQIRAHVADQVDIHREEFAVLGERHPRGRDIVAALRIAHEVLGAIRGPAHRLLQFARGDRQQRVFAIGKQLGAEAAADIRADHPHLLDRNLQDVLAQDVAQPVAALAADRQGQVIALGVVFADRRARLHEACDHARINDRDFGDRMRFRERLVGGLLVADRHVEQHVAGMTGPDLRGARLERVDDAGHGRQRSPLDLDRLDGVARLIDGAGHDEGNGVADMAHFIAGEDRIWRASERIDLQIEQARQVAEIPDVLGRQDQRHAGKPAGAARIDRELRMRMRRTQHQRVQRGLRREVVGIAALAANERVVLFAQDALTDAEFDGSRHPISTSCLQFAAILQRIARRRKGFSGSRPARSLRQRPQALGGWRRAGRDRSTLRSGAPVQS